MRILADENCDAVLIASLRRSGHDVRRIVDFAKGAIDSNVLHAALEEDRVLLTNDTDFGLLAERSDELPPTIILMRLEPLRAAARAEIVIAALVSIGEDYRGKFFVIEPGSIRQRLVGRPE